MCDRTSRHEGLNLARGPASRRPRRPAGQDPALGWRPGCPLHSLSRSGAGATGRAEDGPPGRGERQRGEGGRGGPALQQLLPACDSSAPAVPLGQSQGIVGRERAPRPPLRSPRTKSGHPRCRPPLASPALAQPGRRKREPRADTSSFFFAAAAAAVPVAAAAAAGPAVSQPGGEEAGAERRGPLLTPCGWKRTARRHDGRPARPGHPQAAPEHLRAPAGPRALSAPPRRILHQKHVK